VKEFFINMRRAFVLFIFGFVALAAAACGRTSLEGVTSPVVTSVAAAPTAVPTRVVVEVTAAPETAAAAEATVAPEATAEAAAEAPAEAAVLTVDGDPVAGQQLFNTLIAETGFSCVACHNVASEDRLVGPGLLNVAARAATRVPGMDPITYLRHSIIHPNEYVVETYPENLMPQVYGNLFSEQQVNDLIAYLLTLQS
jgi:cytochrome c2